MVIWGNKSCPMSVDLMESRMVAKLALHKKVHTILKDDTVFVLGTSVIKSWPVILFCSSSIVRYMFIVASV